MNEDDRDAETIKQRLRDGRVIVIKQSDMKKCPHTIMLPSHYHDDGTCRCYDKDDPNMKEWGYYWDDQKKVWVSDEPEG